MSRLTKFFILMVFLMLFLMIMYEDIPPPLPPSNVDQNASLPSESFDTIILKKGIPYFFWAYTITLQNFNHKFQDSPHSSYVWVDVSFQKDKENELRVFREFRDLDENGKPEILLTKEEFGGYVFELTELTYDYWVTLIARKIIHQ